MPRRCLLIALSLGSTFLPAMLRTPPEPRNPGAGVSRLGAGRGERTRTLARAGAVAVAPGVSRLKNDEHRLNARVDIASPRIPGRSTAVPLPPLASTGLAAAGRQALASPGGRQTLASPGVRQTVASQGVQQTVASPGARQTVASQGVRQSLDRMGVRQTLTVPGAPAAPAASASKPGAALPPFKLPLAALAEAESPVGSPRISVEFESAAAVERKAPAASGEVRLELGKLRSGGAGLPVLKAHLPCVPGEQLTRLLDDEAESVRFTVHNDTDEALCFALPRRSLGEAARTRVYAGASGRQGQDLERDLTEFYALKAGESIQVTTDPTLERVAYEITDAQGGPYGLLELTQD